MNDSITAGPASSAATRPVITNIPAPMIAPTPRDISDTGPSTRCNRFSACISPTKVSIDLRRNNWLQLMRHS